MKRWVHMALAVLLVTAHGGSGFATVPPVAETHAHPVVEDHHPVEHSHGGEDGPAFNHPHEEPSAATAAASYEAIASRVSRADVAPQWAAVTASPAVIAVERSYVAAGRAPPGIRSNPLIQSPPLRAPPVL